MKQQAQMTVQESFKGQTLRLIKQSDERTLFQAINALLHATNLALNVAKKLDEFQAFDIIQTLMNDYADVKIEELIYIFKQGKKGLYGPHYNKLDIETIIGWINSYFNSNEYNDHLENRHKTPIEKVELTPEQLQKWKEVREMIESIGKPKEVKIEPITVDRFADNLNKLIPQLTKEELQIFLAEYQKEDNAKGVELITNELNKRK